jgi:hypothetical protein
MSTSYPTLFRCEPADLPRALAPGQVTGLYEGNQWIDWGAEQCLELEVVAASRIEQLARADSRCFHCVLDTDGASPGPVLGYLARRSRGIALISSRAGFLLRWSHRLLVPAATLHPRTSRPFRPRTSGSVVTGVESSLELLECAEVLRSKMLSVVVGNAAAAAGVLESSNPGLQVDATAIHLPLDGRYPEEALSTLRGEGIQVIGSVVWYRLLQSAPQLSPLSSALRPGRPPRPPATG